MANIELLNADGTLSSDLVSYPGEEPEETIARLNALVSDLKVLGFDIPRHPSGYVNERRYVRIRTSEEDQPEYRADLLDN